MKREKRETMEEIELSNWGSIGTLADKENNNNLKQTPSNKRK